MRKNSGLLLSITLFLLFIFHNSVHADAPTSYWVCVSNEKSGDVTLIDGATQKVIATIPVGKRPRGIHPSPDGRALYVALSGRPIEGPPQLDAKGNPIFHKNDDDD